MRYILSVLLVISTLFIGLELTTPVGAATPTVSGEKTIKSSNTQMKKSVLQRKIRMIQAEIKKTETALRYAQKRLDTLKNSGKSTTSVQKKVDMLTEKKASQQKLLDPLLSELALIK